MAIETILSSGSSFDRKDARQNTLGELVNPSDKSLRYQAFLLRLWLIDAEAAPVWRASLEDPHTGERHRFASLTALFAFLHDQTDEMSASSSSPDKTHPLE